MAGLVAVSRTKWLTSMRPLATPSLNSTGSRAARPGTPFGMSRKLAFSPFIRLPRDPSKHQPEWSELTTSITPRRTTSHMRACSASARGDGLHMNFAPSNPGRS